MNIKLKAKRVEKMLTQEEISKKLGMSIGSYNRKETGKLDFTLSEIQELMYILDCDFDDLFFKKDVANKYE
jgi:transcriptional regulator with XRE-family HTH domain